MLLAARRPSMGNVFDLIDTLLDPQGAANAVLDRQQQQAVGNAQVVVAQATGEISAQRQILVAQLDDLANRTTTAIAIKLAITGIVLTGVVMGVQYLRTRGER